MQPLNFFPLLNALVTLQYNGKQPLVQFQKGK